MRRTTIPCGAWLMVLVMINTFAFSATAEDKPVVAAAASSAPAAEASKAADPKEAEAQRDSMRRDTIRYGIDAEVTDLIKTLDGEKEGRFNDDLLELLGNSRSPKLREAILDFFADLEWKGAEKAAIGFVEQRDSMDGELVARSLSYLAAIKSKDALSLVPKIIEENDKKLLIQAIKLAGRSGSSEEEAILLKWLDSDAPTDDLREAAIRALGDIGSVAACQKLMKIVESSDQAKMTRVFACEALGKIGKPEAIPSLVKAANGDDPNVRAQAISALASFQDSAEADRAIIEALRDSVPSVRVAASKAAAKKKLGQALSPLIYKATNDPEKTVKTEAMRSIAELGGGEGFVFLRKYLEESKNDSSLRTLAFGLLLRKDPSGSLSLLTSRLLKESQEKSRDFFTQLAREVANGADAPAAAPLVRILLSDSDYQIRLGGLEWARKTKSPQIKADLSALADKDPSDTIRKRAKDILALY